MNGFGQTRSLLATARRGFRRAGRTLTLATALGLAFGAGARAAPAPDPASRFAIETWTTEHGLPQNSITALLQTRAGYIWASTYNGIAQFDGVRFTVFDSANTKGLPNSRITSLFEDAQGDIWIGHDTGDITRYAHGIFQPVPIHAHWSGGTISGISADAAGDIWALDIRGEALRLRDGRVIAPPPELSADPSVVPQLAADQAHHLLVVRNGGVAEITPAGSHKIDFQSTSTPPYFARVAPARAGGWWVTGDGRVRRWANHAWQEDLGAFPWGDAFVTTLMESSSGRVLVGTLERGLFIHDPQLGWMNLNRSNGLPQDWVRSLAEDREQNLWVGNSGGLVVLRPRQVVMQSPPDGWQGWPVQAIAQAHDGAVWAATEGAGVYRLAGQSWTHFDASAGLSNEFAWSVMEDSREQIWAGTWGGGLFRFEGGRFVRQFDLAEHGEPVTALLENPPGTLWIGTAAGLIRWDGSRLERFAALGGAAAGDVRALAAGHGGALWIGTQGSGLGLIKDGKLRTYRRAEGLPRDYILSLYEEPDGTLWIGTLDRGLCRFRNGQFASITTDQGLPNNVIGHIEDDQLGNLWFNSQQGLFRVSRQDLNDCADGKIPTLRALVFGKAEGLITPAGSSGFTPSGFRSPDGRLWFPTAHGIAVVDPRSVRRNDVPPPVWIEEVLVEGQPAAFTANTETHSHTEAPALRSVTLSPGQRHLDLLFTGISFTSPERVQFRYQLEGLDADWSEVSSRRRVTYPFLPPGQYTFRVRACNSDGLWNETGDAVGIVVLPHVWQTWWFKTGLVIAGFAAVGGLVHLNARRRHRFKLERIARERELERERARIAQDIHDDLGASLTRIGMLSQSAAGDLNDPPRAAANLNHIYATARDLTRAMDEIVWAVNPRHDTLESLTNYLTRFAHDFLSAAGIRCRLDAPVELPDLVVRSEVRHNLFLAFKETLNNAVKHSGATEVRVTVELLPDRLRVAVADNGAGFDPARVTTARTGNRVVSGYGVTGIQARLEQIGGRMELRSRPGEGTQVEFYVPMKRTGPRPAPPTAPTS
ncbi:MAG TPA: two-component regulator propeller domain-containing protein [Verrucomicrobiae bacterium]|nr:two-component regulator propeller domain-containing protein [Verrucomicrobiae bacterium]